MGKVFLFILIGAIQNSLCQASVIPETTQTRSILPTSNQWIFDRTLGHVILMAQKTTVFASTLDVGEYRTTLDHDEFWYPSLDAQVRLYDFIKFSLWGNYSVGMAQESAKLSDLAKGIDLPAETAQLISLPMRLGFEVQWDQVPIVKPSVGYHLSPYFYRLTSSMSGAEDTGNFWTQGPYARLKLPLPFMRMMISAIWIYHRYAWGESKFFREESNLGLGLGWVF